MDGSNRQNKFMFHLSRALQTTKHAPLIYPSQIAAGVGFSAPLRILSDPRLKADPIAAAKNSAAHRGTG